MEPGKNGLVIRSVTPLAAVIKAPPTIAADAINSQAIVRITTSLNVSLLALTITGPGPGPCNSLRYGVRVDGGGSANIFDLRRSQDGVGIYTTTNNTISNNTIIGDFAPFDPSQGSFVLGDGIYAGADTANNLIEDNFLRRNNEHDCHDDSVGPNNPPAFVANLWRSNGGLTENKPGLCRAGDDDDDDDDDGERGDDDDDD